VVADADAGVGARSSESTELPASTIPRAVVPDAADDDDESSSRAIVDAACAPPCSPASVVPAAGAVEPRASAPALSIVVVIAVSAVDQVTLELGEGLASASSSASPASTTHAVAVDPIVVDDVPPAAPAPPAVLSRPVPRLPSVSASGIVSDDGAAGEVVLGTGSSAAAVPDAAGTVKPSLELEDSGAVSASSRAAVERA
jgi:hypothetical protein